MNTMTRIFPANKLLYCCFPIINHLSPFIDKTINDNNDLTFRDIFLDDFIELEQRALSLRVDCAFVQQLKYAMAALVDELILHSTWGGRVEWQGKPLQLYFFAEHLAGEGFFSRLELCRQNSIDNCDLLEVYYVCLQLGFAGMYRIRGQEFLQALQLGLYQQIANVRSQQASDANINNDLTVNHKKTTSHFELSYWLMGIVIIVSLLIIYLSYFYAIDSNADQTDHILDQYVDQINR